MNYQEIGENIAAMEAQLQEALEHGHIAVLPFARQLADYLTYIIDDLVAHDEELAK